MPLTDNTAHQTRIGQCGPGGAQQSCFRLMPLCRRSGPSATFKTERAAIGRRLGYFFLYHTCLNAWTRPITRLTVNTCTLDHPRALPLYQRIGFNAFSREERFVELP